VLDVVFIRIVDCRTGLKEMEKKRWRLAAVRGTMALHLLLLSPAADGRDERTQKHTTLEVPRMRPLVLLVWVGSKQGERK
jgi:hypothetical protein